MYSKYNVSVIVNEMMCLLHRVNLAQVTTYSKSVQQLLHLHACILS